MQGRGRTTRLWPPGGPNGAAQETMRKSGLRETNESMHIVGTDLKKIALQAEYAAFVYYAR